ncbi:unnamed protein product [Adineta steineri]|uniref:Uncharacterized protein n=2 Tax=Adineta steineri TaxID=433720 RepID=A0A814RIF8_9BILA|nr:unnamed protein product [Adineta steineri]CAF3753826.1 unnamed protein product [Adineta steineri]
MLLSTRDAQLERRCSRILASDALADRLTLAGIDNASFQGDTTSEFRALSIVSRIRSNSGIESSPTPTPVTGEAPIKDAETAKTTTKKRYHWRMTHYFYIHISFFILNGFFCGLIIWLIENHSSSRNVQIDVPYVDAWFVASSCVYNCGLTTIDFAKLSKASQSSLMLFTFLSGITISTLPALIVKAHTHKNVAGVTVDDDHGELEDEDMDDLPTFNIRNRRQLPQRIRDQLASLPTAAQLRFRAYITCIFLILGTCFTVYIITFVAIGSWLQTKYTPDQLQQGNSSINPYYISFIVTVTGFNQNGLTPFSDGFSRFVNDVYLNLFVMMVVISGTSLFPFLLRNVVIQVRRLVPWRHKIVFDYILMNNHRLSTLLFPAVQTRIYLSITALLYIMGVCISLILDLNSDNFAMYSPGTRFLIFLFTTVNTRFAGFNTVDMNSFATATLLVYLMLMATKPQMLCAIDESPFELSWLALQAREEVDAKTNPGAGGIDTSNSPIRSPSGSFSSGTGSSGLPMRQMERFLRRQSFVTKDRARQHFANIAVDDGERHKTRHLRGIRTRLFLIYFIRALIKHALSFVLLTRTWLFFFIFLICAIEYRRMAPADPNITVFKIVFEIISAFGAVGLSLGYPNVASSFSSVLSPASKTILILTMLMGRHRGLLASMKDQEAIEHSAADLLQRKREEIIHEYEQRKSRVNITNEEDPEALFTRF